MPPLASLVFGADGGAEQWHMPFHGVDAVQQAAQAWVSAELQARLRPLPMWWTSGSAVVEPAWVVAYFALAAGDFWVLGNETTLAWDRLATLDAAPRAHVLAATPALPALVGACCPASDGVASRALPLVGGRAPVS